MKLTLYNSLTRKKEIFRPRDPERVTIYNCGPTVYSYAHIGNARAAVIADVLFRILRHIYGEEHVRYARNITDVDDKIIAAATDAGVPIREVAEKYARIYNEDLKALGCLKPTCQPKATEHIQDMADLIVVLLDKKIAYEREGHVLFNVTKMDDYGKLSGRKLNDNLAGARVEQAGYKLNPGDFVLWKPAKGGEPGWRQQETGNTYKVDWGKYANRTFANTPGRPGWHIECSAMAKAVLCCEKYGNTIDIHCGGIDLKFPHHENEIAQSRCANGEEFAQIWVHNEFLNMGKDKMSKSLDNIVLIHNLLEDWDGEVIRLALLKAHYRSGLAWSEDLLRESKAQLDGWYRFLLDLNDIETIERDVPKDFLFDLGDDLNSPVALKFLSHDKSNFRYFEKKYRMDESIPSEHITKRRGELANCKGEMLAAANLLGFLQKDPEEWFKGRGRQGGLSDRDIETLIKERTQVRAVKNWIRADEIRDLFIAEGIILEDKPNGSTEWRRA